MANMTHYRPLVDLQREVDRLFESFFPASRENNAEGFMYTPAVDLVELEDAYQVRLDLPGLTRDDVQITFDKGILQIAGERRHFEEENQKKYHRLERWHGRIFRQLRFESPVNSENIRATFENGVLTVLVPKTEESKPRRIEIG